MAEQSTCVRVEPAEPERAHSSSTETKRKSIKKPTGWNSFFQSVAPDVKERLGKEAGIGQVSKVVGNMWKKLPKDRRKTTTSFWTAPKPTTLSSGLRAFVAMAGITVFTILGTMMCVIHFKRKVLLQRARLAEDEKKSMLSWTE